MKRFKTMLITAALIVMGFGFAASIQAQDKIVTNDGQDVTTQDVTTVPSKSLEVVEAKDSFHRNVILAAVEKRRAGELSRRDVLRLRVAMLSPAFRQKAKDLAIMQMSLSGSDAVGTDVAPTGSDGKIKPAAIDWDALLNFIKEIIPMIMQIIEIFL